MSGACMNRKKIAGLQKSADEKTYQKWDLKIFLSVARGDKRDTWRDVTAWGDKCRHVVNRKQGTESIVHKDADAEQRAL